MAKKIDYASMYTLRPDGRYQGYYRDRSGKRHTVCDRDPERLHQKIAEKEAPPVLTFGEIAEAWERDVLENAKPGTRACYDKPFERAKDRFCKIPAAVLSAPEIYKLLAQMAKQDYSAKTIKMQLTVIRQIYKHALVDPIFGEELRYNPADSVTLPSGMKKPKHREAPEDETVSAIRRRAKDAYFGLFALCLMSTGFRRGEALALQWNNIDFKARTIDCYKSVVYRGGKAIVGGTKTEAGIRKPPLLPDLEAALKAVYKAEKPKPTDYVFHGEEDPSVPMPESTYRRKWMHYCKDMGFVETHEELRTSTQGKRYTYTHYRNTLTPHVLRHGYATLLFEADVDVYTAQRLLGHADVSTTMAVYTHLRERQQQKSVQKLITHVQGAIEASDAKK